MRLRRQGTPRRLRPRATTCEARIQGSQSHVSRCLHHSLRSPNGRFLRHRFSPKPKVIATPISLPKRNHVAKEAVSTALQTNARQRSDKRGKPNDAPTTKPWPCVKTMLGDRRLWPVMVEIANQFMGIVIDLEPMPKVCISENS